jgi:hypothetical protein
MQFSIRTAIRLTISIIGRSFVPFAAIAIVVYALDKVLHYAMEAAVYSDLGSAFISDTGGLGPLSYVLIAVGHLLLAFQAGTVTDITLKTANAEPVQLVQVLRNGAITAIPVLIFTWLFALGSVLGAVLLVVPGLFFATAFSIVIPVFVSERKHIIPAFSRAFELTQGHRWKIFVAWFVIGTLTYLLSHMINRQPLLFELNPFFPDVFPEARNVDPMADNLLFIFGFQAASSLLVTFKVALNTVIYLALRKAKEATPEPKVAEIFE